MISTCLCHLCPPNLRYSYQSQTSLVKHEKTKHRNNKIIPHLFTIIAPSSYDMNSLETHLLFNFSGSAESGNLLNDNEWGYKDGSGTVAYALMENKTGTYQVNFTWKEHVYKKHHYPLLCGLMTCSFQIDIQDFVSE
ncbi:hypothetical protein F8M41_025624 [Gigaspora margarita]|uniref:Uncharacterized protein n=1 Tax=Gigaspora margarita TaxID=4874 RepID=A0A8H3XLP0_GIGMA|nr:hypothetical protein F8M41_025624 [Gigaspora margarita]